MTTTRVHALAEFLDPDLTAMVRRMAYRPRPDNGSTDDNPAIRAMIWQGLVGLGLTGPPPDTAGPAADGAGPAPVADSPVGGHEELVAITERLGAALYQGPLLDTVTAADLLARDGRDLPGDGGIALAVRADGAASPADPGAMTVDPTTGGIHAERRFVGFAAEVDHLLVVGTTDDGPRIALVPRDHPTVTVRRHEELGQGELHHVRLTGTPAVWSADGSGWSRALATARIRQAGYLVGLARGAFDLAVAYARQRQQFGQPIGRFQAIAFRLAELSIHLDAARLLTLDAARDADQGRDTRPAAARCLATAADLARTMTTEALQVHGASGLVNDHDAHLFHRRAAIESLWLGSPTQLRAEVLPLLREQLR
ncbi:acyl-CoA dehydrogenase [Polymorphospora sp. NPDC050346]|uniref:acyl-CoA dehydrogenase family protein n=1 Tax=Polymorphospora sp. NPDC050346 TaxID=3155780 RepID=UPI00340D15B4